MGLLYLRNLILAVPTFFMIAQTILQWEFYDLFWNFNFATECPTPVTDVYSPFDQMPTPTPTQSSPGVLFDESQVFSHSSQAQAQTLLHQPQPLSIQTSFENWSSSSEYSPSPHESIPTTPDALPGCDMSPGTSYEQYGQYGVHDFATPTYQHVNPVAQTPVLDAQSYADMPPLVEPPAHLGLQPYSHYGPLQYNAAYPHGQCLDAKYSQPQQQEVLDLELDFSFDFASSVLESNLNPTSKFDQQFTSSCAASFNAGSKYGPGVGCVDLDTNWSDIMAMSAIPSY